MGYMHVLCVFQKCSKKILSPKMCVEIFYAECAVQCRVMWNQCMTRMVSTLLRLGVAETAGGVGLPYADSISACPRV